MLCTCQVEWVTLLSCDALYSMSHNAYRLHKKIWITVILKTITLYRNEIFLPQLSVGETLGCSSRVKHLKNCTTELIPWEILGNADLATDVRWERIEGCVLRPIDSHLRLQKGRGKSGINNKMKLWSWKTGLPAWRITLSCLSARTVSDRSLHSDWSMRALCSCQPRPG